MTKKKYTKPEVSFVKLNPAQAVLTVCSTAASTAKAGGGGTTCKGSGSPSSRCKKEGIGGDSASTC